MAVTLNDAPSKAYIIFSVQFEHEINLCVPLLQWLSLSTYMYSVCMHDNHDSQQ